VAPGLGDGDAVDGGVELSVAGARQAMPFTVAGPHRQWRRAVVAGEGVLALEAADVGGLGDDLRRRQRADTDDCQQRRRQLPDTRGDLALECPLPHRQLANLSKHVGGDARHHSLQLSESGGDGVKVLVARQRPPGRVPRRVEFVEMPSQPVDAPGPLIDQVFSMIDKQPQLTSRPVELSGGQIRVAQRRPSHRQRVDRIRLAIGPRRVTSTGHQLRRHPHDPLPCPQQVGLQSPRQVPAVLHRPAPLPVEPLRPPQHRQMICGGRRRRRQLAKLAADLVDGHHRVAALVRIDPQCHHVPVTFHLVWKKQDRSVGTPQ